MHLGNRRSVACQDSPGGAFCIGSIAFAPPASASPICSVDLDDFDAIALKHMRQSCTVRACTFNAGAAQQPECLSPTEQLFVPFVMGAHRKRPAMAS